MGVLGLSTMRSLTASLLALLAFAGPALADPYPAPQIKTQATGTNSLLAASTAFVQQELGKKFPLFVTFNTADTDASNLLATAKYGVGSDTGSNGIVGAVVSRVPNTFPTGVTGYAKHALAGGTAFSLVGMCDLRAAGSCNSEIDARNYYAPPPAIPGNWAFGTPDAISVGLHLGAGGTYQPLMGLSVGQDGAAPNRFKAGIYMWGDNGPSQYGMLVDATGNPGSGPTTSALLKNQGAGINLILQTAGAASAKSGVLSVLDQYATPQFSVRQDGSTALGSPAQANPLSRLTVGASDTVRGVANAAGWFGVDPTGGSAVGAGLQVGSVNGNSPYVAAGRYGATDSTASPLTFITDTTARVVITPVGSVVFKPLGSAPSSPAEGETYYDSGLHVMRTWNGSGWQNHW